VCAIRWVKPLGAMIFGLLFVCVLQIGMLFISMNTVAIEPHGKIAGMASTVINTLITLGSLIIGIGIAQAFNATLYPFSTGSLVFSILSVGAYYLAIK